jgi:hypothetical protein
VFPIELKFLFNDSKRFSAHFTLYCPVQDVVRDSLDRIWEFRCRNYLLYSREGRLIVRPVEYLPLDKGGRGDFALFSSRYQIPLSLRDIPLSQGGTPHHFFTTERIVLLCHCLIVPKRRKCRRKELSPFTKRNHFLYNPRNQFLIFFFGILFIEDAVGFVAETSTEEKM